MIKLHKHKERSFMIIETIIAVSVIVLALIGPLSAAKSSLTVASDARDYVESVYLADELTEYIRMMRDNNIFEGGSVNWLRGLDRCKDARGCRIDVSTNPGGSASNPNNIAICTTAGVCELNFNATLGIFGYSTGAGWIKTGITRKAVLTETVLNKEARIVITVERQRLNFPLRTYTMSAILTNWKQQLTN